MVYSETTRNQYMQELTVIHTTLMMTCRLLKVGNESCNSSRSKRTTTNTYSTTIIADTRYRKTVRSEYANRGNAQRGHCTQEAHREGGRSARTRKSLRIKLYCGCRVTMPHAPIAVDTVLSD